VGVAFVEQRYSEYCTLTMTVIVHLS